MREMPKNTPAYKEPVWHNMAIWLLSFTPHVTGDGDPLRIARPPSLLFQLTNAGPMAPRRADRMVMVIRAPHAPK